MLDVGAIISTRAFYRAVASGENDSLTTACVNRVAHGLCSWPLLHEQKIAAGIVRLPLTQETDQLQGEGDIAINILVQAVVSAGFVVQQKRSGFLLTCRVA